MTILPPNPRPNVPPQPPSNDEVLPSAAQPPALELDRLMHQLDQRDKTLEKEYMELSRPKIVGAHTLRWDGPLQWMLSFWDRLLWKWFSADVEQAQRREKMRKVPKQNPRNVSHTDVAAKEQTEKKSRLSDPHP